MKRIFVIYTLVIFSLITGLFSFRTFAQKISAEASLSTDSIIIGRQIELNIRASAPSEIKLIPALLEDTVVEGVEVLHVFDIERFKDEDKGVEGFTEKYIVSSFDTGYYYMPGIRLRYIMNNDTSDFYTNSLELNVRPFVLLDTIPVDTIYAREGGFVVFGKDGFRDEVDRYIPDSVKNKVSRDSLQIIKEDVKEQLFQMFASQIMNNTGLTDTDDIRAITEASAQLMHIVGHSGILENHIVAGSVDTVFVQEFQQVQAGQELFTLYRIKDIEESLYDTPYNLAEFWYDLKQFLKKFWWLILLVLFIAVALVYYLIYYRKGEVPQFLKIKPKEPAHIIALRRLEQIRNEKIWKTGQYKEYHVQVTGVLREYLDNRFGLNALEMTSSEILNGIEDNLNSEDYSKLKEMLEIADAVKFAKAVPLQNENDLSLKNAFEIVENTKEVVQEESNSKLVEAEIEIKKEETEDIIEQKDEDKDKQDG
jgi:hypothetical protein